MAKVSLLGVPHDANSSSMRGAAEAPPLIRQELYSDAYSSWSETGIDLGAPGRLVDRGDVAFEAATDPWKSIEEHADRICGSGDRLICLGGDHAITHPIMRAVRRHHPQLTILHIDAHADLYDCYQGNPRSHASPFARIMEERLADRLIQVGLRTVNDHHREQFKRFGVEVIEAAQCGESLHIRLDTPVYISLDMDGLDPAYAPGVSHREPGGLSTRQVIRLIQSIDQPIVAADIVEFNPRNDIGNMTATVVAKLTKEIAGVMLRSAPVFVTSTPGRQM
ncbi:agmatinase [Dyella flagellata]|uniref:Arginase n=1 Tax=Dyella flagellata TaxID=1867833 RepID=A0ABQ5XEB9_9GAMM|nr:agmatinase [Dyella flagellata]GLQ88789.1 arginase [Dyella flagellata]